MITRSNQFSILKKYSELLFKPNYLLSRRKGIEDNIKTKVNEQKQTHQNQNNNEPSVSPQGLLQLSKAKIMNIQFFPITLLLTPTILYFDAFYDPHFLLGTILAEKYSSLMLLMNADFNQSTSFILSIGKGRKITLFMLPLMAAFHSLTGFYSLITPLGMALTTMFLPLKFSQEKERFSEQQKQRINTMSNIRVIYFFIFILLTTVKAFHYEEVYSMERKLKQMDEENIKDLSIKKQ